MSLHLADQAVGGNRLSVLNFKKTEFCVTEPPPTPPSESNQQDNAIRESHQARRVHSQEILLGNREIQIEHAGDIYRLRVTKAGKLILTK